MFSQLKELYSLLTKEQRKNHHHDCPPLGHGKKCDSIYLLANGRVVDQGTYSELAVRNDVFKRMAEHA
jgi:hypothetical protein